MFGPPGPQTPHMPWGYHRPPHGPQWRQNFGPRPPFRSQNQRFSHARPLFQLGNDNYWCETCDRGFATEDILNKHKQQHQKCNIDGCQFIAHPKVITKHIQMQHSTGLYKKIANLKNPEEIAKWREERRKRYPTKSNIEKRAAELKEKIERGEKMGLQRDRGYRNKPNSEQDNRPGQGIKRKFNSRNENQPKSKFNKNNPTDHKNNKNAPPKAKPSPVVVEDNRLKPFAGILNLQMDSDNEIEDDLEELDGLIEDEDDLGKRENIEKILENTKPVVCGALSSLICDYGSSEDEDNEVVKTASKNTTQSSENTHKSNSNVIQSPNEIKPVTEQSISSTMNFDAKVNQQSTDMNYPISNGPKTKKGSALIKNGTETNRNPVNFSNKSAQNNDNPSNRLEENSEIATITSTPVENRDFHNDSGPEEVKPEVSKTYTLEGNGNIKCENVVQKDLVQETVQNEDDNDSGPEETKAEVRKEDISTVSEKSQTEEMRKPAVRKRMQINQRRRPKLPSTLLQKLLFREMQQERNIVLQCIRYIRRNNYFDKKE